MDILTAIPGFTLHLRSQHYSPVTVQYYGQLLTRFAAALGNPPLSPGLDCLSYLQSLSARGLSLSSVQVHRKVLIAFFRWAQAELDLAPPALGSTPHFETAPVVPLTKEQVLKLHKAAKSRRNKAMLLVLLDTGLRASELCRLTISDCDLDAGTIQVRPFATGRKSRPRIVLLGTHAKNALWKYLAERAAEPADPLIATVAGGPLDRWDLAHILRRIGQAAGVKVHPHQIRHTFAIEYLRAGGDVFTLQRLLGHASLEMVRHYLALAQADLAAAHRRSSPADRWL